jgi:hypothetical protein
MLRRRQHLGGCDKVGAGLVRLSSNPPSGQIGRDCGQTHASEGRSDADHNVVGDIARQIIGNLARSHVDEVTRNTTTCDEEGAPRGE